MRKKTSKRMSKNEVNEALEDARIINEFCTFNKVKLSKKQSELYKGINNNIITTVTGPPGTSKAQPLYSKVLTPNGWSTIGDINKGDLVIGVSGNPIEVLEVFPQGIKDIYTITFSDGSQTECCEDHLWAVKSYKIRSNSYKKVNKKKIKIEKPFEILQTKELINNLYHKDRLNYSIPITKPVQFNNNDLLLEPYFIGLLLGDGCLTHQIMYSTSDLELLDYVTNYVKQFDCEFKYIKRKNTYEGRITNKNGNGDIKPKTKNIILDEVRNLELFNTKSNTKFIPKQYLYNSIENRIALLQGLMDTDGYTSGASTVFSTVSETLKNDVIELIQSIGGIATWTKHNTFYTYKNKKIQGQDVFIISIKLEEIMPFRLPRKKQKYIPKTKYKPIRYITNIQYKHRYEAKCILVNDPNHLYITDDYIVTHNTFTACYAAINALKSGNIKQIILVKPLETSGENLGFLPGTEKEKIMPFLQSFLDNFKEMVDGKDLKMFLDSEVIKFVPIAYMRGRTFKNAFIIADECLPSNAKICTGFMKNHGKETYILMSDLVKKVKNGKKIYVNSYNDITGEIEKKEVLSVFENGQKDILKIYATDRTMIECTHTHPIAVLNDDSSIGYVPADKLIKGDKMLKMTKSSAKNNARIVKDGYDILAGFLIGDGSITHNKQKTESYRISKNHGMAQYKYAMFCKDVMKGVEGKAKSGYTGLPICAINSKSIVLCNDFINSCYSNKKKKISNSITNYFTNRTLAIWMMDDGCYHKTSHTFQFCTHGFELCEAEILSDILKNKFNIDNIINIQKNRNSGSKDYPVICINKRDNVDKLFSLVKGLIHEDMAYKTNYTSGPLDPDAYSVEYYKDITACEFDKIETHDKQETYNIEVADNNNYFVHKILTHNCQNADIKQLMTTVTRFSTESKLVIIGDQRQNDINSKYLALDFFIKSILGEEENIFHYKFDKSDIVRHPMIIKIIDNYENAIDKGLIPETKNKN